jgi:NitT/TauT family transport system permease protein
VAPRLKLVDAEFLPPLSQVLETILRMAGSGSLVTHVLLSSGRAAVGLLIALVLGLPAGLVLGYRYPGSYLTMVPSLRLLSHVNPFAMMPVFLLVFGIGESVKIAVVAWVALWPILFYAVTGALNVDRDLIKLGRSFGLSAGALLLRVVLPASFPAAFVGVRIAGGLVFFILVAAEMLGASGGLGWLVHNSAMNYQVRGIYAAALLVVVLGYALDHSLRYLESWLVPRPAGRSEEPQQRSARRPQGPLTRRYGRLPRAMEASA